MSLPPGLIRLQPHYFASCHRPTHSHSHLHNLTSPPLANIRTVFHSEMWNVMICPRKASFFISSLRLTCQRTSPSVFDIPLFLPLSTGLLSHLLGSCLVIGITFWFRQERYQPWKCWFKSVETNHRRLEVNGWDQHQISLRLPLVSNPVSAPPWFCLNLFRLPGQQCLPQLTSHDICY